MSKPHASSPSYSSTIAKIIWTDRCASRGARLVLPAPLLLLRKASRVGALFRFLQLPFRSLCRCRRPPLQLHPKLRPSVMTLLWSSSSPFDLQNRIPSEPSTRPACFPSDSRIPGAGMRLRRHRRPAATTRSSGATSMQRHAKPVQLANPSRACWPQACSTPPPAAGSPCLAAGRDHGLVRAAPSPCPAGPCGESLARVLGFVNLFIPANENDPSRQLKYEFLIQFENDTN